MKTDRKHFIKTGAAAFIASIGIKSAFAADNLPFVPNSSSSVVLPTDEEYWRAIRQLFPLSKDLIYLNNGTMGPSPYPVIEAIKKGMQDTDQYLNYSGWEHAANKLATFVGANENEIALTHNVTEGVNIACWGLPLKKDDEVIMNTHEHVGNAFPWLNRKRLHGIEIKVFTPAKTADETLALIKKLITKKTKVIAIPHIPCTQGQILPVFEVIKMAKELGIFTFIDGAHGPGMLPLNLHEMGCDMYASCCHKWMLGPKGTGFLYVRKNFQTTLQTYFVGGGSDNAKWNMMTSPIEMGDYADSAHRYYGGTQSLGLYKGVEAAVDFITSIGQENIYQRIKHLGTYTQQKLLSFGKKIELLTPTEEKSYCAINGFRIKEVDYAKFYKVALDNKIRIRMVPENSLNCLRISTHIYNNKEEVDQLMELVAKS
jgi:cysteine desulfurase / selenocysteine lyase